MMREKAGFPMEKRLWLTSLVLALFLLGIPLVWFCLELQKPQRLERMLFFGTAFEERSLPEIRRMQVPRDSRFGYDAQFYAQLAFDPALRDPDLVQAIDNPGYRAKRIFMPALAYVTSLGDPSWRLKIMALINPLCWLLLVGGLVRVTGLKTWRDIACVTVCALGSGVLFSVLRALTDLPSAVLSLYGVALAGSGGAVLLSLSILAKETACCTLLGAWGGSLSGRKNLQTAALKVAGILLLPLLWWVYVAWVLGSQNPAGYGNFSFPLLGALQALKAGFLDNLAGIKGAKLEQVLTPISIMLQALYLIWNWRRLQDKIIWRMGLGYAVLALFLGPAVWEEMSAVCRVVIPLTLSFNLLIREKEGPVFCLLFVFGNMGLLEEWVGILFQFF